MCVAILNEQVFWGIAYQVLFLFVFVCKNMFAFSAMFVSFIEEFDETEEMQKKYDLMRKMIDFHNDVKG